MVSKALAAHRIYAVGDVHGHLGKLDGIHAAIARDLDAHGPASAEIVHLGDYIDRGPNSAACIERLLAGSPVEGVPSTCLMGNHERMMLDALAAERAVPHWLGNGGDATLASYGARPRDWRASIPAAHRSFLAGLALTHEVERLLLVHAGVRPGVRLAMQSPEDLLWIREEFLCWPGTMLPDAPELRVVHGHTPGPAPVVRHNRVGVDTNAARGGPVTCGVFCQESVYFLQA